MFWVNSDFVSWQWYGISIDVTSSTYVLETCWLVEKIKNLYKSIEIDSMHECSWIHLFMLNEHGSYRGGLSAFLDFRPRWIIYKPLDKWFVPYRNFTLNWTFIWPLHIFNSRIFQKISQFILETDYGVLGWWELFRIFNLFAPERLNWLSE